jgi:GTP cyclohydrolase IA
MPRARVGCPSDNPDQSVDVRNESAEDTVLAEGRAETIRRAVREIIGAIGEDVDRPGLQDTPTRMAAMYAEVFSGIDLDPVAELAVGFEEGHQEMVVLRGIGFHSMCEHHFLPFYGVAHVGYIPRGRVVGIGKLARVVDILARRPQLQERLTSQVADTIVRGLHPEGVAVVISATHLCMTMRGANKPGGEVITSAMRGCFRKSAATRTEFLSLIR